MELFRKIYYLIFGSEASRPARMTLVVLCLLGAIVCQITLLSSFNQYQSKVLLKSAETLTAQKQYSEAESQAKIATDLNSYDGYPALQQGTTIYLQGRFADAIPLFKMAVPILPHSLNAVRLLGFSYYQLQNYDMASSMLSRYLHVIPEPAASPELVYRMAGLAFLRLGKLAESGYLLLESCSLSEDKGDIFRIRSMIGVLSNQPWTADYCYRAFRRLKPEASYNPLELVSNALSANKLAGATQFLKLAHESDPADKSIIQALAAAYSKSGKQAEAIILISDTVQSHPTDGELRLLLGDLYFNARDYQKSFEQYDEHLRLLPDSRFRKEILRKKATSHF